MKKFITSLLAICMLCICLVGCDKAIVNYNNFYTDHEGIYLTIESVEEGEDGKVLNAVWHNETEEEATFGDAYTIERKDDDEWQNINIVDVNFSHTSYALAPESITSKSYSTSYFDLSQEGVYRLRSWCAVNVESFIVWVEFEVKSATQLDSHKVTMKKEFSLYEELKNSYKAGEEVVVRIPIVTDTGYMFLVNGKPIKEDPWESGKEYWQFTFTMPDEDVVIEFKTYDGFLQYPNESLLIETYWLAYPEAESVRVKNYYDEYPSGAIVAMVEAGNYDTALWTDIIGSYVFEYNNGNRITVLYNGKFYSLSEAYEKGYLTDADMSDIEAKHREYYPYLYD